MQFFLKPEWYYDSILHDSKYFSNCSFTIFSIIFFSVFIGRYSDVSLVLLTFSTDVTIDSFQLCLLLFLLTTYCNPVCFRDSYIYSRSCRLISWNLKLVYITGILFLYYTIPILSLISLMLSMK